MAAFEHNRSLLNSGGVALRFPPLSMRKTSRRGVVIVFDPINGKQSMHQSARMVNWPSQPVQMGRMGEIRDLRAIEVVCRIAINFNLNS